MNVLELFAKLGLDTSEYEKGLDKSKGALSSFGGAVADGFGKIADVGVKTFEAVGAGVAAASAGIGVMAKAAVEGYSSFEQLQGGVSKLYGTGGKSIEEYAASVGKSVNEVKDEYAQLEAATNTVMENAEKAFMTSGMSANQYMETATSFSASLINSLSGDTQKAAEQTDVAMRAISDNVNTFGSDMGSVTNAFQGFAKQNYTMLDNLKLGYGGTKEEMERLIADANEWGEANGKASNLSIESFSDVVTAIEQIQEKQGIAGTTAREAASTVEGSLNMVKGAWDNLLAGLANPNMNLDNLINDIVSAGEALMRNLLPVIERAITGIGSLIEKVAPIINDKIPGIIEQVLPSLLKAATSLLTTLFNNLPDIISSLIPPFITAVNEVLGSLKGVVDNVVKKFMEWLHNVDWKGVATQIAEFLEGGFTSAVTKIASIGMDIITTLVKGITEAAPVLIPAARNTISNFVDFLAEQTPQLMNTATDLIIELAKDLTDPNSINKMVDSSLKLIVALAEGLLDALPKLIEAVPTIIENLIIVFVENVPRISAVAIELMVKLAMALIEALPELLKAIPEIIGALVVGLIDGAGAVAEAGDALINSLKDEILSFDPAEWGRDLISSFISGIESMIDDVVRTASNVAGKIKDILGFSEPSEGPLSNFHTYAPDMMRLFAQGIKDNTKLVTDQLEDSFDFENIISSQNYKGKISVAGDAYGGMVQNLVINAPEQLDPSEIARQTRNANREFVLQMRMA